MDRHRVVYPSRIPGPGWMVTALSCGSWLSSIVFSSQGPSIAARRDESRRSDNRRHCDNWQCDRRLLRMRDHARPVFSSIPFLRGGWPHLNPFLRLRAFALRPLYETSPFPLFPPVRKEELGVDRHSSRPQSRSVMDRLTLMIVVAVILAIVLGLVWWKRES
jgi:hypothetical protein